MTKPCIECGEPSTSTRCPEHRKQHWNKLAGSSRARGYDATWDKISERARRLQPWCSDCGAMEELQADHLPSAWKRKAAGKPIRLADDDVVCPACNTRRGSSRTETLGTRSVDEPSGLGASREPRHSPNQRARRVPPPGLTSL